MTGKARQVMDRVGGFAGPAKCFELTPPLAGQQFVTVFTSVGPVVKGAPTQLETIVVPSFGPDRGGAARSMVRLAGSISGFANHEYALFVAGYALEEDSNGA